MITQTLFVPKSDKWLNSNDRLHPYEKARRTKAWRQAGMLYTRSQHLQPAATYPVEIKAYVHRNRGGKYDPGNWYPTAKAIVDGMVDAGIFIDDDHVHVIGPDMRPGWKHERGAGMTLEIYEMEDKK